MISVTMQFTDIAAAAHALARLVPAEQLGVTVSAVPGGLPAGPIAGMLRPGETLVIAHADRPDVGAPVAPPAPLPDMPAAAAFGGAVAQAAPLVAAQPTLPPAAPTVPSAATGPTVAPVTVEVDCTGLPWDPRIHASTKTKTKEQVWTAKRNVDPAFKAQIEADLRGRPAPTAANPLAGMPAPGTGAALPPAGPALPPAGPAAPKTFAEYMAEIGVPFANRPVDAHNAMQSALATVGLQHVGGLAGRPDLIPAVDTEFKRLLG